MVRLQFHASLFRKEKLQVQHLELSTMTSRPAHDAQTLLQRLHSALTQFRVRLENTQKYDLSSCTFQHPNNICSL